MKNNEPEQISWDALECEAASPNGRWRAKALTDACAMAKNGIREALAVLGYEELGNSIMALWRTLLKESSAHSAPGQLNALKEANQLRNDAVYNPECAEKVANPQQCVNAIKTFRIVATTAAQLRQDTIARQEAAAAAARSIAQQARIYELARRLGLSNRDIVAIATSLGIQVNNHMSLITGLDVDRIVASLRSSKSHRR